MSAAVVGVERLGNETTTCSHVYILFLCRTWGVLGRGGGARTETEIGEKKGGDPRCGGCGWYIRGSRSRFFENISWRRLVTFNLLLFSSLSLSLSLYLSTLVCAFTCVVKRTWKKLEDFLGVDVRKGEGGCVPDSQVFLRPVSISVSPAGAHIDLRIPHFSIYQWYGWRDDICDPSSFFFFFFHPWLFAVFLIIEWVLKYSKMTNCLFESLSIRGPCSSRIPLRHHVYVSYVRDTVIVKYARCKSFHVY